MKLQLRIGRRELVDIIREKSGESRDVQKTHIQDYTVYCFRKLDEAKGQELSEGEVKTLRATVSMFCSKYYKTLLKFKKPELFFKHSSSWLSGHETFHYEGKLEKKNNNGGGRPSVPFISSAPRTQRAKASQLGKDLCLEECLRAAEILMRKDGNEAGAKLIDFLLNNPEKSSEILSGLKNPVPQELTPAEAVSLIIDADLSKSQYCLIRKIAKSHNADIFPSYSRVQEEKNSSLLPLEAVTVTETSAEINIQTLVDMEAEKIINILEKQGKPITNFEGSFILFHKWGCDGSGNHSEHRQPGENTTGKNILLTAQVPLQLKFIPSNGTEPQVLWNNPSPSSTKFCKPLRIAHKKETKESLLEEEKYYSEKMSGLESEVCLSSQNKIKIIHSFKCTMIDGKTKTFLAGAASHSTCCACNATPKKMTDRSLTVDGTVFQYGISVLHCRIRFLECVLHISYKIEIKKWSCNASLYAQRKQDIQDELRKELGLLVDVVQQGSGCSNDGNTARNFFENYEKVADITGFDRELLHRFHCIQTALACSADIEPEKFKIYCLETADRTQKMAF